MLRFLAILILVATFVTALTGQRLTTAELAWGGGPALTAVISASHPA